MINNLPLSHKHMLSQHALQSVLPEEDEFDLRSSALDNGRGVLVTPPIKNLIVDLPGETFN